MKAFFGEQHRVKHWLIAQVLMIVSEFLSAQMWVIAARMYDTILGIFIHNKVHQ